jgi:GAF domain-containing protein
VSVDRHGRIQHVPAQNRRISAPQRGLARRLIRRVPATGHGHPRSGELSGPHAVEIAGLLHELTARLLAADSFTQAVERLAAFGAGAVPGAVRCSVALIGEGGPATITGHGPAGRQLDEIQYGVGSGPALDAARTRTLVSSPDLTADERWPALAAPAHESGVRSVVAVPIDVHRHSVGALSLYTEEPDGISPSMLLTAMAMATQAEVLLGEVRRRDALVEGAAVDRAVGVIIAQRNCGVQEAYAFLQDTAQRLGLDRRTVADRLVTAVARNSGKQ